MYSFKLLFIISSLFLNIQSDDRHNIIKRALLFQRTTVLQFTYGLSVPLILRSRTINLSLACQANYDLPWSLSLLQPKIIMAKSQTNFDISREIFYKYIIDLLQGVGLDGEECLLRSICEIAEYPMHLEQKENLLEKIVHFVFTPSLEMTDTNTTSTLNHRLLEAENLGRDNAKCSKVYAGCSIPLVDIFTSKYIV